MKYKMPSKADLKGRSSTISNAFAISITPYITPAESEVEASYELLKIKEGQCACCLGEGNSKDHLKPLVRKGMPTGYITAIGNLVPCCSACNSAIDRKNRLIAILKEDQEFCDRLNDMIIKKLRENGM